MRDPGKAPIAEPVDIEAILEHPDTISIVGQPIVDIKRAAVVGYELLSRFALGRALTPDKVFAAAEIAGHGAELEAVVIARALDLATTRPANCFVTINIDPIHLRTPEVWAALASRRSLRGIVFEMTEHYAFDDLTGSRRALDALRSRGAIIALDDAGAGYSGLKQILELKPEIVKLDRDLVTDLHTSEAKRALVQMLGELASRLDSWVLAEGVETAEEADALVKLGVPLGQGYFFARPQAPWASIETSAQLFLTAASIAKSFAEPRQTLEAVVEPCLVVSGQEEWPTSSKVVVRVDETRRPTMMQIIGEFGPKKRLSHELMRVKRGATLGDVARRATARSERLRWDPIVCIDDRGNLEGIVPVERLVSALVEACTPASELASPSELPLAVGAVGAEPTHH